LGHPPPPGGAVGPLFFQKKFRPQKPFCLHGAISGGWIPRGGWGQNFHRGPPHRQRSGRNWGCCFIFFPRGGGGKTHPGRGDHTHTTPINFCWGDRVSVLGRGPCCFSGPGGHADPGPGSLSLFLSWLPRSFPSRTSLRWLVLGREKEGSGGSPSARPKTTRGKKHTSKNNWGGKPRFRDWYVGSRPGLGSGGRGEWKQKGGPNPRPPGGGGEHTLDWGGGAPGMLIFFALRGIQGPGDS